MLITLTHKDGLELSAGTGAQHWAKSYPTFYGYFAPGAKAFIHVDVTLADPSGKKNKERVQPKVWIFQMLFICLVLSGVA